MQGDIITHVLTCSLRRIDGRGNVGHGVLKVRVTALSNLLLADEVNQRIFKFRAHSLELLLSFCQLIHHRISIINCTYD
ncbi:hypothetical protein GWI33_020090 [Rhynchophorus ferrugineus]|uniref:Uncharacterized protein n=1 Tax=Rhynchophorus ferrugineus TaxID=354439 RepID=A0A834HS78_RHYFE|nr:hypothetical protein GWI33_020090 [Rhynchophorus ferrugineus]